MDKLKKELANLPSIYMPNFDSPFEIRVNTDTSGDAVGAVLIQVLDDNQEVPIAYASRKLSEV